MVEFLRARGFDDALPGLAVNLIVEVLRREIDEETNIRAEVLFKEEVREGRIKFRLRLDGRNWHMLPRVETTQSPRVLTNSSTE